MNANLRAAAITSAALLLCASAVRADDSLPRRKAGLWEVSMQMASMPGGPRSTSQCIDEKTDEAMQKKALSGGDREQNCRQTSLKRSGNAVDMVADCESPEGKSHIVSHYSGDMQSNYAGTTTVTFDPPRRGMSSMKMDITARYAGACPADMKPGDLRVGGMTVTPGQPGAGRPAMPGGMDMSKLMNMSPEERKQMIEQMKQGMPPKSP